MRAGNPGLSLSLSSLNDTNSEECKGQPSENMVWIYGECLEMAILIWSDYLLVSIVISFMYYIRIIAISSLHSTGGFL